MSIFNIVKAVLGLTREIQSSNPQNPSAPIPETHPSEPVYTYHIADLAEKYETSNKGVGYISNGSKWGDPGGDSYGSYQIETKLGTMDAYLKCNDSYTNTLKAFPINSKIFKAKWVELANSDPKGFQQSQFDFLCEKPGGYNDAIAYATRSGWEYDNCALQSAIFSISNQSGRWKLGIFAKAGIVPIDNISEQINKLYDARAKYFRGLTLSAEIKASILQQRCVNERQDCLRLI